MRDGIAAALRDMLGPAVGIGVSDPSATTDDLWPTENCAMARAIPKRRFEFAAGRRAARQALGELGLPAAAIPMGHDRAPVWPAGLAGTIAHCDTVCIAAISQIHHSIGIDIEPATDLDTDLVPIVCTQTEQSWLNQLPASARGLHAKRVFCAKEAVYKAQYPLMGQMIGFGALSINFCSDDRFGAIFQPQLPPLPSAFGILRVQNGMIIASVVI